MKFYNQDKREFVYRQKKFMILQPKRVMSVNKQLIKQPHFDLKRKFSKAILKPKKFKQKIYKSIQNRQRLLQLNSYDSQKRIFLYKSANKQQQIVKKRCSAYIQYNNNIQQNAINNQVQEKQSVQQVHKKTKCEDLDKRKKVNKRSIPNIKYENQVSSIGTIIKLQNEKQIGYKKRVIKNKRRSVLQKNQITQSAQSVSILIENSSALQQKYIPQNKLQSFQQYQSKYQSNVPPQSITLSQPKYIQLIKQPQQSKQTQTQQQVISVHRHVSRAKIIDRLLLLKNQLALVEYYNKFQFKLRPFIDISFQINQNTLPASIKYSLYRPNRKPAFKLTHAQKITARYFLFKLAFSLNALISLNPYAISDLFQQSFSKIMNRQLYSIWLCIKGQFKPIMVDDLLLQQKQGLPLFCWSGRNEIWPMLLEKSLAKCYKNYKQLDKIQPHELLKTLTGCPCFTSSLKKNNFGIANIQKLLLDGTLIIFKSKNIGLCIFPVIKNLQYPNYKHPKQYEGQYLQLNQIFKIPADKQMKIICNLTTEKGQRVNVQYFDLVRSTQKASFNFIHTNYYYHYQKVDVKNGQAYVLNFSTNDNHVYIDLLSQENQIKLKMNLYQQINRNKQKSQLKFISQTYTNHSKQIFINKNLESGQYNIFFQAFSHNILKSFIKKPKKWPVQNISLKTQTVVISIYSQKQIIAKNVVSLEGKPIGIGNQNISFYGVSPKMVDYELNGIDKRERQNMDRQKSIINIQIFRQDIDKIRNVQNDISEIEQQQSIKQKQAQQQIIKQNKNKKIYTINNTKKYLIDD